MVDKTHATKSVTTRPALSDVFLPLGIDTFTKTLASFAQPLSRALNCRLELRAGAYRPSGLKIGWFQIAVELR